MVWRSQREGQREEEESRFVAGSTCTHVTYIKHNACTGANWRGLLNLFTEHIRNRTWQGYVFSFGLEEGMLPVSRLWARSNVRRLVSLPNSDGMGPCNFVFPNCKYCKLVRLPMDAGMVPPVKSLLLRSNLTRLVRFPNSVGM